MGWKRPRCLERVLAPENFPTTTTAAKVMIDPPTLSLTNILGAGAETDLPLFFPVSKGSYRAHNSPDAIVSWVWIWYGMTLKSDDVVRTAPR